MEWFQLNGFLTASQKKHLIGAMKKRVSCRKYAGDSNTAQWAALSYAASRFCMDGIRIVLGHCDEGFFKAALLPSNTITGVKRFAAVIADAGMPNYKIMAGIAGEAFLLMAADADVASCWVSHSFKRKESPVQLKEGEELICVIALGHEAESVSSRKRKTLAKIIRNEHLAAFPKWALEVAEAVRIAPSYQNIQPWEMRLDGNTLFIYGHKHQQLEMGIALLHAEAAIQAKHTWEWAADGRDIAAKVCVTEDAV